MNKVCQIQTCHFQISVCNKSGGTCFYLELMGREPLLEEPLFEEPPLGEPPLEEPLLGEASLA